MEKRKLHSGAKWFFRFKAYWMLVLLWIILGIVIFTRLGIPAIPKSITTWILYIALILILGEFYAHLAYSMWRYEVREDNIRIERGIIWKKYSNIPYERIQNIDITRGIIARMFGFSALNIQTAGYSGYSRRGNFGEGYIPALSVKGAQDLREFLIKKISKKKSSGL